MPTFQAEAADNKPKKRAHCSGRLPGQAADAAQAGRRRACGREAVSCCPSAVVVCCSWQEEGPIKQLFWDPDS